jgi:hypothetical protein
LPHTVSLSCSATKEEIEMKYRFLAFAVLVLWAAPLLAGDLSKIDRTIAREPAYQGKPKYCLLVFGPEAKVRVWLVLDGDVLYVDRNGNGDLTEKEKRFTGQGTPGDARVTYPFAEIRQFPVLDPVAADGGRKYTRFHVVHTTIKKDFTPDNRSNRELKARFEKDPTLTRAGIEVHLNDKVRVQVVSEWADRPSAAPICHIDGPLTMAPLDLQELRRGSEATKLQFCLGFRGLGKRTDDAFAILDYDEVPKDVQPVAEFTFENKNSDRPPLTVKVKLDRC